MRHRRRRGRFDGALVPLDGVNLIAGIEIRLRQHGAGAESMTRRSRRHLERLHRFFLHAHVDVRCGQLEMLLRRFGRRVVRRFVAHALQHALDRQEQASPAGAAAACRLLRRSCRTSLKSTSCDSGFDGADRRGVPATRRNLDQRGMAPVSGCRLRGGRRRDRHRRHLGSAGIGRPHEIGAGERRLTAQPLGDDGVDIGFAEQRERPPEPLDVRPVPRLARDQILGNHPRLDARPDRQIRVGQLRLRAVHGGFETAVDADLDQPHQRRNVVRHAVDELVQRGGCRAPFVGGNRGPGRDLDALVSRVRIDFGHRAPEDDQRVAPIGIVHEHLLQQRRAFGDAPVAKLHFSQQPQQLRIVPGDFGVSRLRAPARSPRVTSRLTSSTRIGAFAGSASAAVASS